MLCVGTPARKNGSFDYSHLLSATREIGEGIRQKLGSHVVALRSTLLPGTTETLVIPELERSSGKKVGLDFSVHVNPEFLREGSALDDFDNQPFVIIGGAKGSGGLMLEKLYEGTGPLFSRDDKDRGNLEIYLQYLPRA